MVLLDQVERWPSKRYHRWRTKILSSILQQPESSFWIENNFRTILAVIGHRGEKGLKVKTCGNRVFCQARTKLYFPPSKELPSRFAPLLRSLRIWPSSRLARYNSHRSLPNTTRKGSLNFLAKLPSFPINITQMARSQTLSLWAASSRSVSSLAVE